MVIFTNFAGKHKHYETYNQYFSPVGGMPVCLCSKPGKQGVNICKSRIGYPFGTGKWKH